MQKIVHVCQVAAGASAVGTLLFFTHVWDPRFAGAQILLVALIIFTLLGVGPVIVRDLVERAVRGELLACRDKILEGIRVEIQAMARTVGDDTVRSIQLAREEGVVEGALRRAAGETPTPHPRRLRALDEQSQ